MSSVIPVLACILIACGYLVLSVHYLSEAKHDLHLHHDAIACAAKHTPKPLMAASPPERGEE
jgi:hypothetical protein